MGHSSRKKKKSGGGRKTRGKAPSKDHSSQPGDDNELLSEELTALAAIFQEDIKVISEPNHTQLVISLRPYLNDMCIEELSLSALLLVRFLPGYPHKCPKLQIVPEKGLTEKDADRLLSVIVDQAIINSREGRVMIFNLVEAAQEFLSEIAPAQHPFESISFLTSSGKDPSIKEDEKVNNGKRFCPDFSSVYCSVDLYTDLCGDESSWGDHGTKAVNSNQRRPATGHAIPFDKYNTGITLLNEGSTKLEKMASFQHLLQKEYSQVYQTKGVMPKAATTLHVLEEEIEQETMVDGDSNSPSVSGPDDTIDASEKDFDSIENEDLKSFEHIKDCSVSESDNASFSSSSLEEKHDSELHRRKKDLLMVHLLRVACSSNEALSHVFPAISSELYNLGVISAWAKELSNGSPSTFSKTFGHLFSNDSESRISQLWKATSNFTKDKMSLNSRYLNDFEEIHSLGHGGFGHVVLCRNKLDGRHYAVKKIRLKEKNPHVNEKILREVATLSRLQHQHVVRYYQAWVETDIGRSEDATCGSRATDSFSGSYLDSSFASCGGPHNGLESTYLYIQMEYCPRTLRQDFETHATSFDKEYTWHLFRQIVEGLAHIHGQGIIHRDLTPSNIFFDARNDIKIGDFGLAKFLKLEQLDHDQFFSNETAGVSMDGTGQVGTYFYTAPEIEQRWPQINEKVDMYSLGVVFFELWHPFATVMERHVILSDLKQKGVFPSSWVSKFPKQSAILQRLMSPSPADRPSAIELLQHDLPPRMEDELLNDILRALQSSDDSYVYDRVVSSIFDMKRLVTMTHHLENSSSKMIRDEPSFLQYTEVDTELQDNVIEVTKDVFRQHGAKRLEVVPMRILCGHQPINRKTVKLLTVGGDMLELCHELRTPFVNWVVVNQVFSFKRYEINRVYRRAVGHSTPNHFYQGDFDIIGGSSPLTEAEAVKVVMDLATKFFHPSAIDVRLNHTRVLQEIWCWAGVSSEVRQSVAELLSLIVSSPPQSTKRKSNWGFIRRQLLQDLHLAEAVVDRLQTADLRFCGSADNALARLRGAVFPDKLACKALEELSTMVSYLRTWSIVNNVWIDVLMPPTEVYYSGIHFQIFLKEHMQVSASEATLMAVGGRYDYLVQQKWSSENRSNPPGAVGISLALEKVFRLCSIDVRPPRVELNINVLVCSKGGGGLLLERMELVAELWQANMKAEFVPLSDPSLTEQYEYAAEHDIKCLIILTEAGLTQSGLVKCHVQVTVLWLSDQKIRHLELKKEREVERGFIIKFLTEASSTQFRSLSIWN